MAEGFKIASAYVDIEADIDKSIDGAVNKIKNKRPAFEKSGEVLGSSTAKGFSKKAVPETEKAVEKIAKRTEAQFQGMKFAGMFGGLPAAAAAAGAGIVAGLAVAPAAFIGYAAVALSSNEQVMGSFKKLTTNVSTSSTQMAGVLAGPLAGAAGELGDSFNRLQPQIQSAMLGSVPAVSHLTSAVTNFAENAMPGVVTAVKKSEPALKGLQSFASSAGSGISDMFTNMARSSESAGENMRTLGGVTQDLLGFTGNLLSNLSDGGTRVLPIFANALRQGEDTVLKLTAAGGPAISMLEGFGVAGGGLMTVASGVSSALSVIPPQLTSMGGTLLATSMLMGKFGVDGAAGFRGLAKEVRATGAGLTGMEKAGHKVGTALGGLVSGAMNPAALAIGAVTLGLSLLGNAQEKSANNIAAHKQNVQGLTEAYRQDSGVIGEHTTKFNAEALATKNASANLAVFGSNLGTAQLAIEGNSKAMDTMVGSGNAMLATIGKQANLREEDISGLQRINEELSRNGGNYDMVRDRVENLTLAHVEGRRGANALTDAQKGAVMAIMNGTGAIGEQAKAMRDMKELYYLTEQGATGLGRAQIEMRDRTSEHTEALYGQQGAMLGYRGSVLEVKGALENLTEVNKNSKATDLEKQAALLGVEVAMHKQTQAAYETAVANSKGATDAIKHSEGLAAMQRETVNLANGMTGPLTQSLLTTMGNMSATEARAAGLTLGVNKTGDAVYRLPNGKEILITSNADQQAAKMENLRNKINEIPTNKKSSVEIVTIYKTVGTAAVRTGVNAPDVYLYGPHAAKGGLVGYASGGQVSSIQKYAGGGLDISGGGMLRGPGTGTSDSILAKTSSGGNAAVSNKEFVINADDTSKNLGLLKLINSGKFKGYADGGIVDGARDLLGRVANGGLYYEDLSYHGYTDALKNNNDTLQELYNKESGAGWDNREALIRWLQDFTSRSHSGISYAAETVPAAAGSPGTSSSSSYSSTGTGGTTNIYNYMTINPPAEIDQHTLATLIGRDLELRAKTGGF